MATRPPDALDEAASLSRWLADLFAGPLTAAIVQGPARAASADGHLALRVALVRRMAAGCPGGLSALEAERVRLFVNASGGVPAPPYASWWMERTVRGAAAERAAVFYRADGLDTLAGAGPADSLAVELEYVHYLLQHQRAARATDEPRLEAQAREREARFLQEHVRPWIPAFVRAARSATREETWIAAVELLEAFLAAEELGSA